MPATRGFHASSTCATPARGTSCARRSTGCLATRSTKIRWRCCAPASTSAMRASTGMPPRSGRWRSSAIACACASPCRNTGRARRQQREARSRPPGRARGRFFSPARPAAGGCQFHRPCRRRAVRCHYRRPARLDGAHRPPRQPDSREMSMDAITVQILRNKVASLVDEMHYHFYRSGYSTIIRESRDFSCVILDASGRLIVAPPMFFHAPVYRHLVGRILKLYGERAAGIADGDVFVSNHPYEGGLPHVSDMAFVAPVFSEERIVAFAGSIAHKADVGGAVPGSTSANATEMFHEGVLIPPVKIRAAGRALPDIERLILANSRQPELVRGDVRAQIAVTEMGAARVKDLCARFGADSVTDAFAAILQGAADEMRAALRQLPDGTASAEGFLDSDGVVVDQPIRLAVTVTIHDGLASFDFSASDAQARGP